MTFIFEEVTRPDVIRRERIITRIVVAVIILAIVSGALYVIFKNWPQERAVKRFVAALEQGDYQQAYKIWQPNSSYSFNSFMRDWGPKGDYGKITSFKFVRSRSYGNGVIVTTMINGRQVRIWVDRGSKALTFAPF
jgi:hypothetical protein